VVATPVVQARPHLWRTRTEIADRISAYIREEELVDPSQRLDPDTPLLNGRLDSGDLLRLVEFLEESFGLSIEHADLTAEHFDTIRSLERFVIVELGRTSRPRAQDGHEVDPAT
jgi:acyl carrier protein